ncbi:alpha/beta fold hydrolase [Arsenicicoccus sp. oral taxon 190]|uniref:alpha/beta fold hydrolase n=1 Tax=Arsenicicoccus sp. oral taxon 190 TaxID=1658671 RepID=UPI00067A152B|nr:alpha/beta hydrolase [Arsenicicoccus sp. oral taxon 190]AKT50294.1 hypothetical protein ADJ73_01280 [Arsenicicoccus sp. oral taxon 190]
MTPGTRWVEGPAGPLEVLTAGRGEPGTVFAHGVGADIGSTRPFASGVRGARTFFHFRGHGASVLPDLPWSYADLAAELRAVADHVAASRAVGISMGAGAVLRLLAETPDRFERVVLVLPATVDQPRRGHGVDELQRLGRRLAEGDDAAALEFFESDAGAGSAAAAAARDWARDMAAEVTGGRLRRAGLARALTTMPGQAPLADPEPLRQVRRPVLVLGQDGDAVHPAYVARHLGELLPRATVHVLPPGGLLWAHRDEVRRLVGGFLSG